MAGTFTQIYIHAVFAVKGRENVLRKPWRDELFKYMCGIVNEKGQKPIIVNGVEDHVHLLVGLRPSMNISDLIRDVKNSSSKFINMKGFIPGKFAWQSGFGGFSYSQSQLSKVYGYILNQEKHHSKRSFRDEYVELLKRFEVEYDERFLFKGIE